MPDYTTPLQQARALRDLLLEDQDTVEARHQHRLRAWAAVAKTTDGQLCLEYLALILLRPDVGQEGRNIISGIFDAVRRGHERE